MSLINKLLQAATTKPMSETEEQRWRRRRASGRRAFIWKWGVLPFGCLMFIWVLVMFYLMGDMQIASAPLFALFLLLICFLGSWWFSRVL